MAPDNGVRTVAPWRKSSYSGGGNTECVEVARWSSIVAVRDTKNRTGGHFAVSRTAWQAFTRAATSGGLSR